MYFPEYLSVGDSIIVKANNLKSFGKITKLFYDVPEVFTHPCLPRVERSNGARVRADSF
jgi:hypothetical protein